MSATTSPRSSRISITPMSRAVAARSNRMSWRRRGSASARPGTFRLSTAARIERSYISMLRAMSRSRTCRRFQDVWSALAQASRRRSASIRPDVTTMPSGARMPRAIQVRAERNHGATRRQTFIGPPRTAFRRRALAWRALTAAFSTGGPVLHSGGSVHDPRQLVNRAARPSGSAPAGETCRVTRQLMPAVSVIVTGAPWMSAIAAARLRPWPAVRRAALRLPFGVYHRSSVFAGRAGARRDAGDTWASARPPAVRWGTPPKGVAVPRSAASAKSKTQSHAGARPIVVDPERPAW